MSNHIDFYFDIISPYAYIAHKKILKHKNIIFNYKPIYLGGLHKLAGIDSPVFNKYKLRNNINDCNLVSEKNNIEFKWNSNFPINSLNIMRGLLSIKSNKKNIYIDNFYNAYWQDNLNLNEEKIIFSILKKCKINKNDFQKKIKDKKVKDKLKKLTNDAYKKDIFGAPTFVVNNKIFWGQDRLEYALDELYTNEN